MKFNQSVLILTVLSLSIFSCEKETTNPVSEEFVVYESNAIVAERAANTATINWSSTGLVDARFEVVDAATNAVLYAYGWIYFTSGSKTANYTVPTGSTVLLRIKARRAVGAPVSTLSYTFTSTCSVPGCCNSGNFTVNAPAGTSWFSIPGNGLYTGACL